MNNKTIIHLRFGGLSPVTTAAANADWFAAPKSRSAVLKSSLTTVDGLPKTLKIFRIAGSRYWQIRIYSYGRYVMRSLKTVDAEQAKTLAKKFYADLLDTGRVDAWAQAHQQKLTYCPVANQMGLHDLIQEVIQAEREKLARHDITAGTFAMTKGRLEGLVFDFFCTRPIARIDTETIELFVNQLTAKGLTTRTIQGYLAYLKKLLRLMFRKKVIMHFPLFPHIKANSVSRGAFTLTEYKAILRKARALQSCAFAHEGLAQRVWMREQYHAMPVQMQWLIRFMVHTFVRPGDIRQIQNKHIEIVRNGFCYLRLTTPQIKRHSAPMVSMPAAVGIYERVLDYQTQRGFGKPDDYVFFPEQKNRPLALDAMGWLFNWALNELGIKQGPHGVSRTLYSLRHTAITFRLIYGGKVDLLTLARNARTSVEMIDKFYASTLSAEMNIALLHSKRNHGAPA